MRLHGPVVEEEREPAPLVLLGGDDLLGESRALGFAALRVLEDAFSLLLPRVCEHRRGEITGSRTARIRRYEGGSVQPSANPTLLDRPHGRDDERDRGPQF